MTDKYDFFESLAEAAAQEQIAHDQAVLSDFFFNLAMELTDCKLLGVDDFIRLQCFANGLVFPPQPLPKINA